MSESTVDNWLDEAIQRESIPKVLRNDTVEEFCKKWGIADATYFYQMSKKDNWEKILEITLNTAKKATPEILEKLREKAEGGDIKAIEMFLDYVLKLAKNLDIKSDGKQLLPLSGFSYVQPNKTDNSSTSEATPSVADITK